METIGTHQWDSRQRDVGMTYNYPTRTEILANLDIPNLLITNKIALWKREYYKNWSNKSKEAQLRALKTLIRLLNHNEPVKMIIDDHWAYDYTTQKIHMSRTNPSIISALHELSHHLYGPSELKACTYSISIFKHCFPKSYQRLAWRQHKLTKHA